MSNEPESIIAAMRRDWITAGLMSADTAPLAPRTEDQEREEILRHLSRQRMDRFRSICPAEFLAKIDREKLPNLAAWDEADAWRGGHPGLWLWSAETGRGKTRMLWRQFGRLHVERGRSILRMTGQALAEEYFAHHMAGTPRAFYRGVMGHDVVMLDDLDKIDTGDARSPRMLRELFDELYAHRKPVLVTANEPIDYFAKRIGESTTRRMSAVCAPIAF